MPRFRSSNPPFIHHLAAISDFFFRAFSVCNLSVHAVVTKVSFDLCYSKYEKTLLLVGKCGPFV